MNNQSRHLDDQDLEYVIDTNPTRTLELTIIEHLEKEDPILAEKVRKALKA